MSNTDEQLSFELRSEEVQEILGVPPNWIIRWGTTLMFLILLLLFALSWIVKYPDVIVAPLTLTTAQPPVKVVARTTGYISQIYVSDSSVVKQNDVLMVIQNTAKWDDVLQLEREIAKLTNFTEKQFLSYQPIRTLSLGALQADYTRFLQYFESYVVAKNINYKSNSLHQLNTQTQRLKNAIENDRDLIANAEKKVELAQAAFKRQQSLYVERLISLQDLENAKLRVTEAEDFLKSQRQSLINRELEIDRINSEKLDINKNDTQQLAVNFVQLQQSVNELNDAINHWKLQYLLTAPFNGKITLKKDVKPQFFVNENAVLAEIIPESININSEQIIAKIKLPIAGSGKVKIGQRVLIKLDSYPYQEYGKLETTIASKSELPEDEQFYNITANLQQKLITNFGKKIDFQQKMSGTAEIITEERRLIERIFNKFISGFQ
ncbi:MAG: HlyD family efflux transporter periplasmic adaptor subunit [Saprospiraceae bacterium]|nr:HlyD family efflux transporter periplasmic adaptor subunit [Saprospiraceae bacterium]